MTGCWLSDGFVQIARERADYLIERGARFGRYDSYDPDTRERGGLDRHIFDVDGDVDSCLSARTESRF